MEKKKIGILKNNTLERKEGNFEPNSAYIAEMEKKEAVKASKRKKNKIGYANQQESIKIPSVTRSELIALKAITKTKFDYEVIQLLIDNYTNNFSAEKMKKFKLLKEISLEE